MIISATNYWTANNPRRTTTTYIVIHHAGVTYRPGRAINSIYSYHRTRWPAYNAAGYHLIIQEEEDGTKRCYLVNDPWVVGAGVLNHNHHSFHICLAANFQNEVPDESWLTAAKIAVAFAKTLFPDASVVGHRDLGATECPGNRWAEWRAALSDIPSPLHLWVSTLQVEAPIRVPSLEYQEDAPIMATPLLTGERAVTALVRAALSRPYRSLSESTIRDIAQQYVTVGEQVGVDYLVAMAQMIHETGALTSFWSQPPRHNLAGIGVTGASSVVPKDDPLWSYDPQRNKWVYGVSFPSYEAGVRAHLGRLVAYATKPDQRTDAQRALVDEALSYRPLPAQLHGVAPRWIDLNGKWAVPGTTYGQQIIQIANQLVKWV